jgi:tetratricopeptide (TPR) repeat protein
MSRTLYVLKYNKEMVQLGECTLKVAGIKKDHETKIEVLIDELGWCNYQLKKEKEAIENVNKAVEFYNSLKKEPSDRIKLAYYKGLRHLSIMNAKNNYSQSEEYLNEALEFLEKEKESQLVQIDIAQVYNAKALIIAINLGIYSNKNILRSGDENGKKQVVKAIGFVKQACYIFEQLGEIDRHIKSVELHHRLSESIGDKTVCSELQGIKKDLEKKSPWMTKKS